MLDLLIIAAAASMLVAIHISHKLERSLKAMSQATDALTAALAGLTTSVNALIAAKENTVAIDAATASVTTLKASVDAALAPPAPAA